METKIYYIDRNKNHYLGRKSVIVWYEYKPNASFPVAYIRKTKYATEKEFEDFLKAIQK